MENYIVLLWFKSIFLQINGHISLTFEFFNMKSQMTSIFCRVIYAMFSKNYLKTTSSQSLSFIIKMVLIKCFTHVKTHLWKCWFLPFIFSFKDVRMSRYRSWKYPYINTKLFVKSFNKWKYRKWFFRFCIFFGIKDIWEVAVACEIIKVN